MFYTLFQVAILALAGFGMLELYENPNIVKKVSMYYKNGFSESFSRDIKVPYVLHHKQPFGIDKKVQHSCIMYVPHIVVEIKVVNQRQEVETIHQLWDLSDGEVVLNTGKWKKTKGLEDLMMSNIDNNTYRIALALAHKDMPMTTEDISKETGIDLQEVRIAIEKSKSLDVFFVNNNEVRLAINSPILPDFPATDNISLLLSTVNYASKNAKIKEEVHKEEKIIELLNKKLFGNNYKVKSIKKLYIPVTQVIIGDGNKVYVKDLIGSYTEI